MLNPEQYAGKIAILSGMLLWRNKLFHGNETQTLFVLEIGLKTTQRVVISNMMYCCICLIIRRL